MEIGNDTSKTRRNLEANVVCLECGANRHFLPTHLRLQHQMTTAEYRERNGLSSDDPIYSQVYSDHLSLSHKSALGLEVGSMMGKSWARSRREATGVLASQGYFVAKLAAEYIGIPEQTLQSAMHDSRLPKSLASQLIRAKRGFAKGIIIKLIFVEDLEIFAQSHTPKKRE